MHYGLSTDAATGNVLSLPLNKPDIDKVLLWLYRGTMYALIARKVNVGQRASDQLNA